MIDRLPAGGGTWTGFLKYGSSLEMQNWGEQEDSKWKAPEQSQETQLEQMVMRLKHQLVRKHRFPWTDETGCDVKWNEWKENWWLPTLRKWTEYIKTFKSFTYVAIRPHFALSILVTVGFFKSRNMTAYLSIHLFILILSWSNFTGFDPSSRPNKIIFRYWFCHGI